LYEQICPNPQPHKPAKDKKHNRGKKKEGNERKKKSTTWHLPTSCMHPIKPVTLGLQRVKGGEKNQSKDE